MYSPPQWVPWALGFLEDFMGPIVLPIVYSNSLASITNNIANSLASITNSLTNSLANIANSLTCSLASSLARGNMTRNTPANPWEYTWERLVRLSTWNRLEWERTSRLMRLL